MFLCWHEDPEGAHTNSEEDSQAAPRYSVHARRSRAPSGGLGIFLWASSFGPEPRTDRPREQLLFRCTVGESRGKVPFSMTRQSLRAAGLPPPSPAVIAARSRYARRNAGASNSAPEERDSGDAIGDDDGGQQLRVMTAELEAAQARISELEELCSSTAARATEAEHLVEMMANERDEAAAAVAAQAAEERAARKLRWAEARKLLGDTVEKGLAAQRDAVVARRSAEAERARTAEVQAKAEEDKKRMLDAHQRQIETLQAQLADRRRALPPTMAAGVGADGMSIGPAVAVEPPAAAAAVGGDHEDDDLGAGGDDGDDLGDSDDEMLTEMRKVVAQLEELKHSTRAVGGGKGTAALGVPPPRYKVTGDAADGGNASGGGDDGTGGDGSGGSSRDPLRALTSASAVLTSRLSSRPPPLVGDGLPADAAPIAPSTTVVCDAAGAVAETAAAVETKVAADGVKQKPAANPPARVLPHLAGPPDPKTGSSANPALPDPALSESGGGGDVADAGGGGLAAGAVGSVGGSIAHANLRDTGAQHQTADGGAAPRGFAAPPPPPPPLGQVGAGDAPPRPGGGAWSIFGQIPEIDVGSVPEHLLDPGLAAAKHAAAQPHSNLREKAFEVGAAVDGLDSEQRMEHGLPPTPAGKLLVAASDGLWHECMLVSHVDKHSAVVAVGQTSYTVPLAVTMAFDPSLVGGAHELELPATVYVGGLPDSEGKREFRPTALYMGARTGLYHAVQHDPAGEALPKCAVRFDDGSMATVATERLVQYEGHEQLAGTRFAVSSGDVVRPSPRRALAAVAAAAPPGLPLPETPKGVGAGSDGFQANSAWQQSAMDGDGTHMESVSPFSMLSEVSSITPGSGSHTGMTFRPNAKAPPEPAHSKCAALPAPPAYNSTGAGQTGSERVAMALEGAAKGQAEVNRYQYEQREVESAARLRTTVSAESSDHKFARFLASGGDSFEGRSIGIDANGYGVESKFYTAVWKVVRDRSALIPKGVVVKFTTRAYSLNTIL